MLAAANIRTVETIGLHGVHVGQFKKKCILIWRKRTLQMHTLQISLSLSLSLVYTVELGYNVIKGT
jgi:hypothetical protein